MSGRRVLATFALLVLVTGSLDSVYAQAPPVYKVEDLGSLGGQYLIALAMNNNGDVAGANIAHRRRGAKDRGLDSPPSTDAAAQAKPTLSSM
jgi:hypothetical protein